MNPVLIEIYSTILPSAPYVIAAYALIWLILLVYVAIVVSGMKKTEKQIAVLEEALRDAAVSSKGE
ncbi:MULTISPECIES: CcmD family protein [unclassified Adlercreutzia]|uniref:CcmD family protein n=1 Tax=unclassified Adlercreutzia TaxID=2636013 RepID=UPI0013EABBDE|nr:MULTISPECIES: CcmD family protein [unclassified Adlercreutzia]